MQGQRQDLKKLLARQEVLELEVHIGQRERLACRLLAVRVPQQVAAKRRERLRIEAKRKGQVVSKEALRLCDWTVLVSNAPQELLSLEEALILGRTRWQIELMFKLWKSIGMLDESTSSKPWRVLCEFYAKLLGLLVQHWLFLISCWDLPDKSLFRAAKAVQRFAVGIAVHFHNSQALTHWLEKMKGVIQRTCRMGKRGQRPLNYQLLSQFP